MTFNLIQNSFVAGEMSPDLYGRTDLAKWRNGASTLRNAFVNYRGGAYSRAGTAYVGTCKQPGTSAPPKDIPFQFSISQGYALEFGDQYMRIKSNGAYVIETPKNITGITQANPAVFTSASHGFSIGDWVFISSVVGMTNFNGLTWIVNSATTNTFTITDLFGNTVDSTLFNAYVSGGTAARIYTVVAPYAAVDLPYLKYTQSADTMSLTCVNTVTNTEYPPYDLERFGATNWTFTSPTFASAISAPTGVAVTAQNSTTVSTWYSYVVTAIDANTGEESVASLVVTIENNDISVFAGSNTITWKAVSGASGYNVYKATPSYSVATPIGALFGYAGTALGSSFTDTNIIADMTRVPPVHENPFARGSVTSVLPVTGGSSYTQATIGYTVTTSTGTGFAGTPIVVGGVFVAFVITNNGSGYALSDTISITTSGPGTGATASFNVGAETGTYPATVAYFQQRRAYAATLNQPDTYFFSQIGAFLNFDSSIPVTDADAFSGAPWAQQVNGIQFMIPMPGGLVIFTGKGAWQLNGGANAALTAATQTAQPQGYNGCSAIVPPITINYDILYVQAKGSIIRDLSYNFFANIYTGTDKTVLSGHLFQNYQILQWAYAEEPFKIIWALRNDGTLLSLTYLLEQDIYGWARHDTNGQYVNVCSITEPPVDAVYVIVKRYVQGGWHYYSERMDNRNWPDVDLCFCVDAGLKWPMTFPNATLTPAAAQGTNNITLINLIAGGNGYTSPTITVKDPVGLGTGATFSATIVSGVITAITPLTSGQNYAAGSTLQISDPTGLGAIAQPIITNNVTFTASSGVFSAGDVGQVIRGGGGEAEVTSYVNSTTVIANVIQNITGTIPNDPSNMPAPIISGNWSITPKTSVVTGLNHINGLTVSILADGSVFPSQVVTNNSITLPHACSAITIGLPYLVQAQTLYLDPQGEKSTAQGKRKDIYAVTVRMEASRGMSVGTNQPDQATQANNATVPWTNMKEFKERNARITAGSAIPLFSGDERILVPGDWATNGQVAVQQPYPLPANILAVIPEFQIGDTSG